MNNHFSIQEIARQIAQGEKGLAEVSASLPCYLHINSLEDFSILEADKDVLYEFQISIEEINKKGFELIEKIVFKEDLVNAVNQNINYINRQNEMTHVSFFQRLKLPHSEKVQMYYTRGKIIDTGRILNMSVPMQNIEVFNQSIFKICEKTEVIQKKAPYMNRLTQTELKISRLLVDCDSIKSVASVLNSSENTIKNHKTNIFRKLDVRNYFEFYNFIKDFDLEWFGK